MKYQFQKYNVSIQVKNKVINCTTIHFNVYYPFYKVIYFYITGRLYEKWYSINSNNATTKDLMKIKTQIKELLNDSPKVAFTLRDNKERRYRLYDYFMEGKNDTYYLYSKEV